MSEKMIKIILLKIVWLKWKMYDYGDEMEQEI